MTRSLYLGLPGTGWPSYTARHRVPLSLPSMTRRAMVGKSVFLQINYTFILRKVVNNLQYSPIRET
jgi:hypothetical protein